MLSLQMNELAHHFRSEPEKSWNERIVNKSFLLHMRQQKRGGAEGGIRKNFI